jgi:hypothetical protein
MGRGTGCGGRGTKPRRVPLSRAAGAESTGRETVSAGGGPTLSAAGRAPAESARARDELQAAAQAATIAAMRNGLVGRTSPPGRCE